MKNYSKNPREILKCFLTDTGTSVIGEASWENSLASVECLENQTMSVRTLRMPNVI